MGGAEPAGRAEPLLDVAGAGDTEGTVAPPRPGEPQTFESRFARNGRGAPSSEVPPLKAQSGQTGKGDAAPLILPAQEVGPLSAKGGPHGTGGIGDQEVHQGHVIDPSLGQDETVPFAPGDNGWRGDPAQETYVRDGATQSLTSRFGSSGTDYPDAEAGWLVAGQEPDPTGGQELAATLKGQRGKGGGGIGPEETLLPVDEATGFYSTGGTRGVSGNEGESPALKVGSGLGIPSPPAVFSKRHAASDAEDSETWDESEQAHTLNQNMNAPDVAADAQAVRRLTPTEAERLQGMPDGWTLAMPVRRADDEELRILRGAAGDESLSERPEGTSIRGAEVLRLAVQGSGDETASADRGGGEGAGQEARPEGDPRRALRIVWDYGRAPIPTSQGWRPAEQRTGERLDFVSWLSYVRGVGERYLREQADPGHHEAGPRDRAHPFLGHVPLEDRGPSLADAPAWHDLRTPPSPLRAVTINEGNDTPQGSVWESDQCGSLATGGGKPGQGYHAVRTEADPTWIGLDNANRGNDHVKEGEPNAEALRAKGTLDQAVGFYPNQGSGSNSSGAREGEAPTIAGGGGGNTPAVAYSLHSDAMGRDGAAKADSPDAEGRMRKRDAGMGIAEGESYSLTAGQAHGVAYDATSPPLTAAGFHGNADGSDDQVEATALAFEARYYSDRERMGGAPSGEAGPVKATDSKAGDAAQVVAFAQNQRDEVRELDDASSLSGQGTHQTTYVAGAIAAVAEGTARPFDCPPDGSRYAALGDAVTAPVVRWQAERLVDVLRERGVIKPDGSVDLTADLDENLQPLFPITPAK